MFSTFFLSEIRSGFRQPMLYIFFLLMMVMPFAAVVSDNISIGGAVGNVYKNAPYIISVFSAMLSIFGLLIATAYFNNAALRDYQHQFHEILFSTPLSKAGYFFGRFFGALVLASVPMLGIYAGFALGSLIGPAVGWVDSERIGPIFVEPIINSYFLFIVPNFFFAGTLIFAFASKWKSTIISFVGTLLIIVGYFVSGTLMSDISNHTAAALTDPFGLRAFSVATRYFTPAEKNLLGPSFSGLLLYNRLVWIGVGALILALTYWSFSFREKARRFLQKQATPAKAAVQQKVFAPVTIPTIAGRFSASTHWQQFLSFFKINLLSILKSPTFIILFIFSAVLLIVGFVDGYEYYGLQSYPVTYKVIETIDQSAIIFVLIILVFFSGELVFMNRDKHIHEVIDAAPHPALTSLIARAVTLVTLTVILQFFFILCGVIFQLLSGYTQLELGLYFADFFLTAFPSFIMWSVILLFIQVLVNNKYLGYFASVLFMFMLDPLYSMLDISSNMLNPGGKPHMIYSDMNGFGPALEGVVWFDIYWVLFATVLLLITGVLWKRGLMESFGNRLKAGFKRLRGSYAITLGGVTALWLLVAGFVFYNTKILNSYHTQDEQEELQVQYEEQYKKYETIPLPKVTEVKYHIDIFPEERDVHVKAEMVLENTTEQPIESLHYTMGHFTASDDWRAEFDIPNGEVVHDDEEVGYRIYRLKNPLQPGEKLPVTISAAYISRGFENEVSNLSVVKNGTFLNNAEILPIMGYTSDYEIQDQNKRREQGLPPNDRMPALTEDCGEACMQNYLTNGRADWVQVETVISTSPGQIAVAPGSLRKEWQEDGRNYYHYVVDHPSQNFYSFTSADFEVARKQWGDVAIEVYYDEAHGYNIDRMIAAVERSLEYYTEHFGPYYHRQARIIEFPRYASFAQAFPGTMPYSESVGFITNLEGEDNNIVDAVIAHEMAHQWWAHQEVGANMQGGTLLTETLAEYSALMTMKSISDDMKMKEFLKYNLDMYLSGRSFETQKELPLYKVENQGYIHYRKGSVILYALQDYIGEEQVNEALRGFLAEYRYQPPPYPTSHDLLRHISGQVPDSLQYLITDWFREITLYDYRLKDATYRPLENGRYEVTMDVEAYKLKAATLGNEHQVPVNDWVEIGAFADEDEEQLLHAQRVKFTQPEMTFRFTVDTVPAKAAIDPRRLLIERDYGDNVEKVEKSEQVEGVVAER